MRVPTYQSRTGLETSAPPRVHVDKSAGRAIQGLGRQIQALGDHYQAQREAQENLYAKNKFIELNNELSQQYIQSEDAAPANGEGLFDSWFTNTDDKAAIFHEKASAFVEQLPDRLKEKFQPQLSALQGSYQDRLAKKELSLQREFGETVIGKQLEASLVALHDDPSIIEALEKDIAETISESGLPQAKQLELLNSAREDMLFASVQGEVARNPERALVELGGGTPVQRNAVTTDNLIAAVMKAESNGNPNAKSSAGALGLMQVMPGTGADIAKEIGDANFPSSKTDIEAYLKRPDVSVKYGTYYLNKQLNKFDGDLEAALIAYNAGPGNAEKWLKSGRDYASLPKRSETEPYVRKISSYLDGGITKPEYKQPTFKFRGAKGYRLANDNDWQNVNPDLKDRVGRAFGSLGIDEILINSAHRNPFKNRSVGGVSGSEHLDGNAVDINVSSMSKVQRINVIKALSSMGITGIGVGENIIHADLGGRRAWGYGKGGKNGRELVPDWAESTIAAHLDGQITQVTTGRVADKYAALPLEKRQKLLNKAQSNIDKNLNDQQAALKANYDSSFETLMFAIEDGEADLQSIDLFRQSHAEMPYSDFKQAVDRHDKLQGDRLSESAALRDLNDPSYVVDFTDTEDKKKVNSVFNRLVGEGDLEQDAISDAVRLVKRANMIPKAFEGRIRSLIDQENPQAIKQGFDIIDQLIQVAPQATRRDLPERVIDRYDNFMSLQGYASDEQIVEATRTPITVPEQNVRQVLDEQADTYLEDVGIPQILDKMDDSLFGWNEAETPLDPDVGERLRLDFRSVFKERFLELRDLNLAEKAAIKKLKTRWGKSQVNNGEMMKFPPEHHYPAVDGSHDWMVKQLQTEMGEFRNTNSRDARSSDKDKDIGFKARLDVETGASELKKFSLVPTRETAIQIKNGERPSYRVIVEENQVLTPIFDEGGAMLTFTFDPSKFQSDFRKSFNDERKFDPQRDVPLGVDMNDIWNRAAPIDAN